MQKTYEHPKKYQIEIPAKIRKKLACMQGFCYCFTNWKVHYWIFEIFFYQLTPRRRSPMMVNGLDSGMLKKVKDIALETRMAGGVINRRQLRSIATGVVRVNITNPLKEYGGDLVLTNKWARGVLEKLMWSKCKGTTRKVDPSPSF